MLQFKRISYNPTTCLPNPAQLLIFFGKGVKTTRHPPSRRLDSRIIDCRELQCRITDTALSQRHRSLALALALDSKLQISLTLLGLPENGVDISKPGSSLGLGPRLAAYKGPQEPHPSPFHCQAKQAIRQASGQAETAPARPPSSLVCLFVRSLARSFIRSLVHPRAPWVSRRIRPHFFVGTILAGQVSGLLEA